MLLSTHLTDHLKAYLTLLLDAEDLLSLSLVSPTWYIFCNEEPLWMIQVLRKHHGNFTYHLPSWKHLYFCPRPSAAMSRPPARPSIALPTNAFTSDFLYRRYCRCHMDISSFTPPSVDTRIPRVSMTTLTPTLFFGQYARRPVILTDAISSWPSFTPGSPQQWTIESLVARFGDVVCRVTHNLDVQPPIRMPLADFAAYAAAQHDETPLYVFDQHFGTTMPPLLDDYAIPSVFNEDLLAVLPPEVRPDFRWLVVGPARSGASWHVDPAKTSAWNALLVGRKRWAMYPPGRCPPGVTLLDEDTASPGTSSLDWFLHVYPTLSDDDRPLEIVQEAGDVISVPSGWWHVVLNLEFSIAVTQNVVDSHNLTDFVQDLIVDGSVDRVHQLHALVAPKHPLVGHLLALHCMPLDEGYLHESAMVEHAFSDVMTWQPRIRTIFHKHHNLTTAIQSHLTHHPWTTPIHPLTSRVNPTFSIHDHLVIKWFSPLNRLWGECHEAHVLTVDFPKSGREEVPTTTITTQTTTATTSSTLLGRLLEAAFDMEQLVYSLLSAAKTKPLTPKMVASGYLHPRPTDDKWTWPYVVTTFDPELASLGQAVKTHGGLTRASWSALVQWMGCDWFPMFHGLQVPSRPGVLGTDISSLQWYIEYLQRLRDGCFTVHSQQNVMPARLVRQLDSYLPLHASSLVTSDTPVVLLHQDLTDENILGYMTASSPSTTSPLMTALACLPPLDRAALEGYCQAHGITTVAELVAVEPWADCTGASDASRWVVFRQAQVKRSKTLLYIYICLSSAYMVFCHYYIYTRLSRSRVVCDIFVLIWV
ncbi:hypothetical protein, variant [Aphanomyces astaci]|uniref:JmjC domain-containing protein n=1 Tax=Aphanomyces astaci TaxID=112090 RepID=W4H3F5_APHAT|nr:hypothetical protein, variant [Aphanomyces astaci]ETV86432.1 hypothetical protein, variant [Aphanomyces astaci]|eukprot:XP_009823231.1 hypothetical protein, variant [Aphanomyces astaci]